MNNQPETDKDTLWDKLSANWQSNDSEQLLEHTVPNDPTLISKVKKAMKLDVINMLLAVVISLLSVSVIVSEILQGLPSIFDVIFYYGALAIMLIAVTVILSFIRSNIKAQTDSTKSYIELSLHQVHIGLNLCRTGQICGIAILLLFFGIVTWMFFLWLTLPPSPHTFAKPITAGLIVAFFSLFFPAMLYFIHKQKVKLTVQKQSLINLLSSSS